MMPTTQGLSSGRRLGKEAWVIAARDALIEGGIEGVKVDRLANQLKAQRGSFYHHFNNRDSLLQALLQHWLDNNSAIYNAAAKRPLDKARATLSYINTMWLEENEFNPHYDSAIRDWGRTAPSIAAVVRQVDQQRIGILQELFQGMGYSHDTALGRARVAYFHQVGYIALGLNESPQERQQLAAMYLQVLIGHDPSSKITGAKSE